MKSTTGLKLFFSEFCIEYRCSMLNSFKIYFIIYLVQKGLGENLFVTNIMSYNTIIMTRHYDEYGGVSTVHNVKYLLT